MACMIDETDNRHTHQRTNKEMLGSCWSAGRRRVLATKLESGDSRRPRWTLTGLLLARSHNFYQLGKPPIKEIYRLFFALAFLDMVSCSSPMIRIAGGGGYPEFRKALRIAGQP